MAWKLSSNNSSYLLSIFQGSRVLDRIDFCLIFLLYYSIIKVIHNKLRYSQQQSQRTFNNLHMNDKSTLPLFHFLFCELIEQCYTNHKQDNYLEALKKSGREVGFKMYNLICIRKQITERPNSIATLVKNIQTKVFRFLFNYDAINTYTAASEEGVTPKQFYHVIQDNVSIYLTWLPQHLWDTSAFFAGLIEAICQCSGLDCKVTSYSKLESGDNPMTEYQIKISQVQNQRWKDNE